jgi:peptide chain release factor 1
MQFAQKLDQLEKRFDELTQQMADPAVISDADQYRKITKSQSELSDIISTYRQWKKVDDGLAQARQMLEDQDADLRWPNRKWRSSNPRRSGSRSS